MQIMQCCIMSGEAAFAAGAGVPGFVLVPTVLYRKYTPQSPPQIDRTWVFLTAWLWCSAKSVGSVTLTSGSVFDAPTIDPNFLTDPEGYDLQVLSEVVDLARSITRSGAMSGVVDSELSPAGMPWGLVRFFIERY